MVKLKRKVRGVVDLVAYGLGYRRPKRAYQDSRFPEDQYRLISGVPEYTRLTSALEVGCNKGLLVRRFANDGIFAVGLDVSPHWAFDDNERAILGVWPVSSDNVQRLPSFDAVSLLSVHHQWVKDRGDEYAQCLVRDLYKKARICMFIEFAAIATKYGYQHGERFIDNDEESVTSYAKLWLAEAGAEKSEFLGATRELEGKEPHRFLFVLRK